MVKNIASFLALTLTISILFYVSLSTNESIDLSDFSTEGLNLNYSVTNDSEIAANFEETTDETPELFSPYLGKTFVGFKEALAFKESRGDYNCINTFGYLGKYQFGKGTLRLIGIDNASKFLKDPQLQEKAFIANAQRNKWILRKDIKNFVGKRINGVLVTESGILAAAHLAGPGSVKKYLRSYGINNFEDGFGTTISYYMRKFSGYDTSYLKPDRQAKAI